jgi:hypothetical protein
LKNNKDELYLKLGTIGFRVTSPLKRNSLNEIDIEKTLVESLYNIDTDGRLLSLILSWLKVHGSHVIADKFFNEYSNAKEYLGESPWFSGICSYMFKLKDHRFKKGLRKLKYPHSFGLRDQSSLIKIKGAVAFLQDMGIQVPNSALRIREEDIFTVEQLVKVNLQYRNRCIFGANWRAEIVTSIQNGARNPNQVAKLLGIARSRVGIVFKEYMLVREFI